VTTGTIAIHIRGQSHPLPEPECADNEPLAAESETTTAVYVAARATTPVRTEVHPILSLM